MSKIIECVSNLWHCQKFSPEVTPPVQRFCKACKGSCRNWLPIILLCLELFDLFLVNFTFSKILYRWSLKACKMLFASRLGIVVKRIHYLTLSCLFSSFWDCRPFEGNLNIENLNIEFYIWIHFPRGWRHTCIGLAYELSVPMV